ncbi:MAG: hypothetical protein II842_17895 [Butyrivibrio sp.]|nr:hypothetical protein [Butyrivibrio sp.]
MGDNDNLEITAKKQEFKQKEITIEEKKVQENVGIPPVINSDLEKFNKKEEKKSAVTTVEKKSVNELAGDCIISYEKQLSEDESEKEATLVDYDRFDYMSMKEILDAMKKDTNTKHKAFTEMEEAFKTLVNYGEHYKNAIKNGKAPLEYADVFRLAENTARFYQVSHKKWIFGTNYGKERYKISCRILDIIKGLREYTRIFTEKALAAVEEKVDDAQIDTAIEEESITDKEKGEVIGDWLESGKEYKQALIKILKDQKLLDKDKKALARIVADKNRRLMANKVTLNLICDENPDLTMELSELKLRLNKYLSEKINKDNDSKKLIFEEVGKFRTEVSKLLADYKNENKAFLDRTSQRKEKFVKTLNIDPHDEKFWSMSDINTFLLDLEDGAFEMQLDAYKNQNADNLAILDQYVDELGYSALSAERIKEKIRKDLGVKLLINGEIGTAELVKDEIKRLRFLAAEEFEAESRITHLMDVLQIPKSEKDVFAKYISGDGTVGGILKQKTRALRKKGDAFVENLKGLKEAENLTRNKKLMLKEETWNKIEDLKNNMGTYDKKSFRAELNKILKSNSEGKIDVSKPNMTYNAFYKRRTQSVRQDIGFSARIMGDLFLKDKEIAGILDKEETEFFRDNLLKNLSVNGKDVGDLEFLPTGAIKAIAARLKKNLVSNKNFIKDLRNQFKDNKAVSNEVLMKMTLSSELLNIEDLNDLVGQVKEKHEYDGRMEEEKKKIMGALKADGENDASLSKERFEHFTRQLDFLKKLKQGRYSLFAEQLANKTDIFAVMMNQDQKTLESYLESTVDKKIGVFIDAINASKLQKAFKDIYIEKKFDQIYNGEMDGTISHIKEDMVREQKKFFAEKKIDEGKVDKTVENASKAAVKDIVGKDKKNVGKLGDVYTCVERVVAGCYADKDKLTLLNSKDKLTDEIKKAYNNLSGNRDAVLEKIKELSDKSDSVFFGYGKKNSDKAKDAYVNAARFIKSINDKMMFSKKEDLLKELPELIENCEKTYRKVMTDNESKMVTKEELEKGKEVIEKKASRETIRSDRDKLLGLDKVTDVIKDIFERKTLVTIGTAGSTSLSHDNWQKSRDYIKKEISKYYDLDPFLVDLVVEKNVNELFGDKMMVHAKWLYNAADILGTTDEKEDKISEDEKKLLIVNAYRHMEGFKDNDGEYKDDRNTVKGKWYKTFRENYKELKKIEDIKISYGPLEQERLNITRQLRALLATGIGIKDQDKDAKTSFKTMAEKAFAYIDYVNKFMTCADEALSENELYSKEKANIKNDYILALRQYYHDRIMEEVRDYDGTDFKEAKWKTELSAFAKDTAKVRFVCNEAINESVSSKTYNQKNKNFSELVGRDQIDKLIKDEGSHGCLKKYNDLSESEKELFALGLMLMEKGAIGFDAGSAAVLVNSELREKEVEPRMKELANYMAGLDYDFKVDYTQAYYKLTNIGLSTFGKEKRAFSSSAFEKAWQFAKAVTGQIGKKDESVTKEDKLRMGDGISSIYEAALLGKKDQIDEVDKLRKNQQSLTSVKDQLLEYAKEDSDKVAFYEKVNNVTDTLRKAPVMSLYVDVNTMLIKDVEEEIRARKKCVEKLEKLDSIDMYKIVAILQNRAVLDDSSKGGGNHIDEEKRQELKLLFSEDNQEKALEQFGSSGACMQALITALSFKIEDKRTLKGSTLSKKDFDKKSYDRKGKVDWRLLEKAFDFLEELEHDKTVRFAIRNAPNYIEASGNEKAIKAYKENVKGKEDSIKKDTLEEFLKKEAEKDTKAKDNEDAKLALSGYNKLTPEQKKLFIKVLGRRDFLDISKKNLYRNIFKYSAERNFANETGRFRLIDEYIDQSLGGNEGVVLSSTAYADAFKSLLSTQVDDTADFKDVKHIGDILSKEKYYIAKRDTAVDWKLFVRALQFVNRATYELDLREGNDELYRSAGNITRFGHLSMDYSILRKNIHNTGNQFLRFGVQQGKKVLADDALGAVKIGGTKIKDLKNGLKDVTKIIAPNYVDKMDKIGDLLEVDAKKKEKRLDPIPETIAKELKKLNVKDMTKEMLLGKIMTSNASLSNEITELVINSASKGIKVDKIGELIKKKIEEKPQAGKEKRLDSIIGDFKVESQYGDIRDDINEITTKYKEIKGMPEKIKKDIKQKLQIDTIEQILNLGVASSIKEAIQRGYADATAYVLSKVDTSKGVVSDGLDKNKPFVKEVEGAVKQVIDMYKKQNKDIKELMKKPQEFVDLVQKKAKETTGTIIEGAIGKDAMTYIKESTDVITGFADSLKKKVTDVFGKINKYKQYIDDFADIALSIKNKQLLNQADNMANKESLKKSDAETLKKAEEFEDSRQKKIKDNVVEEHKDLQKLSRQTADTIQDVAIAEDAMKLSVALAQEIFGKIDAGVATGVVKAVVDAGIRFASYCIRVVKDRKMLKNYYTDTKRGQKVISDIKNSYSEMVGSKEVMEKELKNRDTLDLVCKGNGYENKDELVRDTGMKMATSIAFCASDYNPVKETKVMATTVLIVLGLKDKIGKTDAATIAGIFDKMKAA